MSTTDDSQNPVSQQVDEILDAALTVFAEIGLSRSTVDDIARRAGVGRVTIYRKIGKKDEVLAAVLIRESGRLFAQVHAAADAADDYRDRVVNAFATTVSAIRENPVWMKILDLEPQTVLEQLTIDGGGLLASAIEATAGVLRVDGDDVSDDDLQARAEILVRITHSILLTPQAVLPLSTYAEVEDFARKHLLPIASPTTRS